MKGNRILEALLDRSWFNRINISMHTLLIACLIIMSSQVYANSSTASEIVHRANQVLYYAGQDWRTHAKMTITDEKGRTRQRQMVILRWDKARTDELENNAYRDEQKFYVYFTQPADISKMSLLVWKKTTSDDERWLYLPALDLVRRIAPTDKRTSFVGSDFFYEDISGRNVDEDLHELIDTTENYFVIKNTPRNPSTAEFSSYKMYIHKDTFVTVQIEYFDSKGEQYRVARALKVDTIQGHPTVTKASMENLETGSKTVIEYNEVQYDVGLSEDIFSERHLRNPPQNFLH